MTKLLVINGPNLNLLGKRQPEIYGSTDFEGYLTKLRSKFPGIEIDYYQSNIEGELISRIQEADGNYSGIIINAGGYSHTSVAIPDAISSIQIPTVGVHITNIYNREPERHIELLAGSCKGMITGLGLSGYEYALRFLLDWLQYS